MKTICFSLLLSMMSFAGLAQQPAQAVSNKTAKKWVKKKEWANGLALEPHQTVNKPAFYTAYHTNQKWWDAAFAFLKEQNLDEIKPGKYPIVGEDVFASVTEAPSHPKEEVKWESHRKYIDLQYIIKGKEIIGIADASKATITKPYTVDVVNYTADGKYYTTEPGKFFLFFPNDAHRPTIKAEGYDVVKKIVIKIRVDANQ
ncbi:YhcH/YjgK/YiaL family protein [Flavihumibacter profundi]|uniref:YhcH/YjgK/YiaL family protein n=1 Tax=Flavihumibacter profundi TaxID=2716883 RepID=UPI001CC3BBBC|nr:YhcH/YjgK/YiaL family protein [Flavihumibacter profundi]MBZ5856017.1 YhcH/YjgK/YiaL family protein [Flavihumibacter profundi]